MCNFKFASSHIKKRGKINFNDIFYLIQSIQNIILANYQYKSE